MIDIENCKLRNITPQGNYGIILEQGDKLAPNVNSEIYAFMLSNELEKIGYKTRVNQNIENGQWSVAIL